MRRVHWLPLLFLAGCDGCGARRADEAAAAAIPKTDQLVFDLRTTAMIEFEERFAPLIEAVVSEAQREKLEEELALGLGFDPSTRAGLEAAGLDPEARVAGGFDGEQLLLAVPTTDTAKARKLLSDALAARFGKGEEADGVTRFERSFGPDTIEAAALAARDSVLLVAFREGATERVKKGLALSRSESAAALLPVGAKDVVRVRTPDPKEGARRLLAAVPAGLRAGLDADKVDAIIASVRRSSLDLRWLDNGLRVAAETAFEGAEAIDPYVAAKGAVPPGLEALAAEKAILGLRLALGPDAVYDALLPPNSPGRRAIEKARAEGKLRLDFEKDVLPLLSGHLAIALGVNDLREVPFRQIVGDPLSVSWIGIGIGTRKDSDLMAPFAAQMAADPRVKVKTRELGESKVSTFLLGEKPLVEAAEGERALLFGTDPGVLDRVVQAEARSSPAVPMELSIRFDPLEEVARSFPGSKLPLVFRGLWARMLDGLAALDELQARVVREADTVQLTLDLALDPVEGAKLE